MDVQLTGGGCHADALVLEHTAESAHRMSLEMRQVDHEVVVLQVTAHAVVLYPFAVCNRNVHRPFGVHDVHRGDLIISALLDGLQVAGRRGAVPAVCGITFDQIAADLLNQVLDEFRPKMIALGRLSRRYLDCHASAGRNTQRLIDTDEPRSTDVRSIINGWSVRIGLRSGRDNHLGGLVVFLCCSPLLAGRRRKEQG